MNDRTKHIKPKTWMAFALLLFLLLQGCITTDSDLYNPYYTNVAQDDIDWAFGRPYYQIQAKLASLTDEQREIYEREKEAVVVEGTSEFVLFADIYHQGYKEGYAYCKATKCLRGRQRSISKDSICYFSSPCDMTPLHEAYGQGWDDGQEAAFDQGWFWNRE